MKNSKKEKIEEMVSRLVDNKIELEALEEFFKLPQKQLLKAMKTYLKREYKKVIHTKKYVMAVGDIPVALVAHLDTVFKHPPVNIFYDREKCVMWSPEGLGADDRAGVYSIVQILKAGYRPTVIFTTDEEVGGIGASRLVSDLYESPTDLKYIIELDRKDFNDCVFYSCDNKDFTEYVESFGFATSFGTFSDISIICPAWRVAGVNLSIGYYGEHDYTELLCVRHMYITIEKVKAMLEDAKFAKHYEYIEDIKSYYSKWSPSYGVSKQKWQSYTEPSSKCSCCGNWAYDFEMYPIEKNGKKMLYCMDCVVQDDNLEWCVVCGDPFYPDEEHRNEDVSICNSCRGAK